MTSFTGEPSPIGALPDGAGGWTFRLWAPYADHPTLVLPELNLEVPLAAADGWWTAELRDLPRGSRYGFRLVPGGPLRADPASRWQPDGVLGLSALWSDQAVWTDQDWRGLDPQGAAFSLYELHVGTFTERGTFDAVVEELPRLVDLGVTALELLPVSRCPGRWNWGYDAAFPYAVQDTFGGAEGLARLVDAAHRAGLGVVADVVYNHIGPEGVHWEEFGPYFSDRHTTPWGPALNFDGPDSDPVRQFFLGHALEWFARFHLDGFRFDAVHAVQDQTALPFWEQVTTAVHALGEQVGRRAWLVAETDWNAPRVVRPPAIGGLGFDAFWSDDVHHAVHAAVTADRAGYYQDFGTLEDVAAALSQGLVQTGRWSGYRRRHYGRPYEPLDAASVVVYLQNHDQVGNRPAGDRLGQQVGAELAKGAAGVILTSPFVPMLFMGEEYGEPAPFLYFVDHQDPSLLAAVREGRAVEARQFGWTDPTRDPTQPSAFHDSCLTRVRDEGIWRFYRTLLAWRRTEPALASRQRERTVARISGDGRGLIMERRDPGQHLAIVWMPGTCDGPWALPLPPGRWRLRLEAAAPEFGGPGGVMPARADNRTAVAVAAGSFSIWERLPWAEPGRSEREGVKW